MPVRVVKEGNKWVVTDRSGKTRFVHDSETKAKAQQRAINASLARMRRA